MKSDLEPFAMVPRDLIGTVSPRALEVWAIMAAWFVRDESVFKPPVARIAGALGCSRRVIERALSELVAFGRLARISGKLKGKSNEYELRFTRREKWPAQGAKETTQGYDENGAPTNKVVKTYLKHTPVVPRDGEQELPDQWPEFWKLYPRKDKAERARAVWRSLAPADQAAALEGVRALAEIYKAAPDDRRRFTVQAHRWLAERRWTDDTGAVETHYHAIGAVTQAARRRQREEASRRQNEQFAREEAEARERFRQEREAAQRKGA